MSGPPPGILQVATMRCLLKLITEIDPALRFVTRDTGRRGLHRGRRAGSGTDEPEYARTGAIDLPDAAGNQVSDIEKPPVG